MGSAPRIRALSVSRLAHLQRPRVQGGIAVLTVTGFGILAAALPFPYDAFAIASAFLLHGLLYLAGGIAGTRAIRRERDWAHTQPFAIEGYLERLGHRPSSVRLALSVTVDLAGLKLDRVRDLVRHVSADMTVEAREGGLYLREDSFDEDDDNAYVARRLHALVDRFLLPLHRAHPIAEVRLF